MRERAPNLDQLATQLRRRTAKLVLLVRSARSPADHEVDRCVAYATIEVLNAWSSFTRAFFISSALRARTATGVRVMITAPGIATAQDALAVAMRKLRNKKAIGPVSRHQEPSWHPASNIITLISEIGASNLGAVTAALSYPTQAFRCLPIARNFFAHRNGDTAAQCRGLCASLSVPPVWRPSDVLLQRDYTRPNNLLTEWISDVVTVAELMVQ